MLIIVSDIHLTDGSSETVHQGTLRVFRERVRSLAYAASWRADGRYEPLEELVIVLLGDIVDVLRSTRWLDGTNGQNNTLRPWSDPRQPEYAARVAEITSAAIETNRVFFAMLRELGDTSIATLPPATERGRPALARPQGPDFERIPVRVKVYYMTGNHDWYFHLPYAAYDSSREQLVRAMGLANDPRQPFPHDPGEPAAGEVRRALDEHGVFARHGDIFDPLNFEGSRDASSLGDAIVIDLVTRFAFEVKSGLGDQLPPECIAALNEIDNVRPLWMVPVWVGGLLRRTCPDRRRRRAVEEVWTSAVDRFLRIPFVRERVSPGRSFLAAEKLKLALRISGRFLRRDASRLLCLLHERAMPPVNSYLKFALREEAFRRRQARFVVYGHTHRHEMAPLDSVGSPAGFTNQIYLNSGTWRPVHEIARYRTTSEVFVGYNTMTYLAFFKDGERSGRAFESWSGSLAKSSSR
ncbi:MAG: hypothetical protein ACRD3D_05730 [Terriglobia bacterium]